MHPRVTATDRAVDAWVARVRRPSVDAVMFRLSSAADHSLLWFTIGTARALGRGGWPFAGRFAAAMAAESAITNGPVKAAFERRRPPDNPIETEGPLPYGLHRPITSSFPSGHATAAFTAAELLADRHRTPWYLLAALVASSRVYVRMHFLSDVVGGAVFGIVLGRVLRRWVRP